MILTMDHWKVVRIDVREPARQNPKGEGLRVDTLMPNLDIDLRVLGMLEFHLYLYYPQNTSIYRFKIISIGIFL